MGRCVGGLLLYLVAAALIAACSPSASTPPTGVVSAAAPSSSEVGPSPVATPTATPSAAATPARPPSPSPSAAASSGAAPPAVESFWDAVLRGLSKAGRLRINVIGPNAGVLRYEPDASETVADGKVVFVCVDGAAFDGQGGTFVAVPGSWECGGGALVGGFRNTGQPVDAWGDTLPTDSAIAERTAREPDGRWRWDYTAESPVFGGQVTTTVWVDPGTGKILDARRTDPTGSTRYGISYEETFPPISRP